MKKTVTVEMSKTFEIEIPDEILGAEAVKKFSEYLYEIQSIEEIFEYVAYNIIQGNDGFTLDYTGLLAKQGVSYGGKTGDTTYKQLDSFEDYLVQ